MTKDSFVVYKSWAEMMAKMPDAELAELTRAIMCYQTGIDYEINNPMVEAVFSMMRGQFEKDDDKYEETCEKNRQTALAREAKKREARTSTDVHERAQAYTKSTDNDNDSDNESDYDSDFKEKSVAKATPKEKTQKRFSPPTTEQVKEYCLERGNSIDPEAFVDFYSAKGWKVGSQSMKDWRAAVRTWEKRDKEKARSGTTNKFNTFEQRQNNFDEIEARMFNKKFGT